MEITVKAFYQIENLSKPTEELTNFLRGNYIESKKYSVQYSLKFLEWALYGKDKYIIVMRIKRKIVGCITAVIRNVNIFSDISDWIDLKSNSSLLHCNDCAIVNFLSVHKDYRNKSINSYPISSILKQELFKHVVHDNLNIYGLFTIAYSDKKPLTNLNTSMQNFYFINKLRYYHRPINVKKLVKNNYLPKEIEEFKYLIKETVKTLLPMRENHIKMVTEILNNSEYKLKYNYTKDEVKNIFLNNDVCKTYVQLQNDKVTNIVSFYILPSKIKESNIKLNIAYIYYCTLNNYNELLLILKISKMPNVMVVLFVISLKRIHFFSRAIQSL